jgi:hypothetical protein
MARRIAIDISERMITLCKIIGHSGTWKNARAENGNWRSHCGRCGSPLVRAVNGGGWQREDHSPSSTLAN